MRADKRMYAPVRAIVAVWQSTAEYVEIMLRETEKGKKG